MGTAKGRGDSERVGGRRKVLGFDRWLYLQLLSDIGLGFHEETMVGNGQVESRRARTHGQQQREALWVAVKPCDFVGALCL